MQRQRRCQLVWMPLAWLRSCGSHLLFPLCNPSLIGIIFLPSSASITGKLHAPFHAHPVSTLASSDGTKDHHRSATGARGAGNERGPATTRGHAC